MHAPHHVSRDWVEPFRGRYDDGWEAMRERVFDRQLDLGIVPEGTTLTDRPSWVPSWSELYADERTLYARMQETYAGFLAHTDAQIGKVLHTLEQQGILDDTIVILTSDNGASAEGGQQGTFNEMRFSHHLPESTERNLAFSDDWGGFRSYSHYALGWAWAGNAPFKLWKRYTWLGGTRTPLVVHWPAGIEARGEVRSQFCHASDIMPTVLDAVGVAVPDLVDGVPQQRIDGVSLGPTFDDAGRPSPRTHQYFEMLGSRSMYVDGWKATTDHVSMGVADEERLLGGSREFADDAWSLYDLRTDFAEAHDLAADQPEILAMLRTRWDDEAHANGVFPLYDSLMGRLEHLNLPEHRPDPRTTFLPGGGRIEARGHAPAGAEGVLCALGDWSSVYALFVTGGRLHFALTIGGEQFVVRAEIDLPAGALDVACALQPVDGVVEMTLHHGDEAVGRGRTELSMPFALQHGGTMLCLGYDRGFPVCDSYEVPFAWTGEVTEVVVDAGSPPQLSVADALHHD